MTRLTLEVATRIVDAALAHAASRDAKPLAVVVLDAGTHPLVLKRNEAASLFRAEIATAKAHGALGMGSGSRTLAERAAASPSFFTALSAVTAGRIVPAPGGVLIRAADGGIVGAVGISGDQSDIDEACAIAGIVAVGLVPDPGGSHHG
ncbi:GlcG/HbpS family heme-binding protein [Sphingomonas sp. BAUL-RG-20F-R05-02]|uniref:GlcG/HbpS family heme-binding protein n=1 Tax=Sphingomonas sp. BAUL-RG-20F-R05-02 TaxID=2914830 RepID=UPI001F58B05B|nr:heme-binding protein [Sphingomonas sp. BAUL-RG-20F-R05-02]